MGRKRKEPSWEDQVDSLRDEYESSKEWKLRRMFLVANIETLTVDRLVCLSRCFINSAMYGCSYPKKVMREIQQRSGGMLDEYQQEVKVDRTAAAKQAYANSFVKASSDDGPGDSNSLPQQSSGYRQTESGSLSFGRPGFGFGKSGAAGYSGSTGSQRSSHIEEYHTQDDYKQYHQQQEQLYGEVEQQNEGEEEEDEEEEREEEEDEEEKEEEEDEEEEQGEEGGDVDYESSDDDSPQPERRKQSQKVKIVVIRRNKGPKKDSRKDDIKVPKAKPVLSSEEYRRLWQEEIDPFFKKLRLLAHMTSQSAKTLACTKIAESKHITLLKTQFRFKKALARKLGQTTAAHVLFDGVYVSVGAGSTRFRARRNGYESALQKVYLPYHRMFVDEKGHQHLEGSLHPFDMYTEAQPTSDSAKILQMYTKKEEPSVCKPSNESKRKRKVEPEEDPTDVPYTTTSSNIASVKSKGKTLCSDLSQFIVVEGHNGVPVGWEVGALVRSADFSGMLLEYELTMEGSNCVTCVVKVGGRTIATSSGLSKKEAKWKGAVNALDFLRSKCWVLRIKSADESGVLSKDELLLKIQSKKDASDAIGSSNIGNQLLRKMGWTGGGVGKHGSGIVEPVAADGVVGRAGLGLDSVSDGSFNPKTFRRTINNTLRHYVASGEQDELKFSPEFTKDERAIIHQEATKMNLKSNSKGTSNRRYITVARKQSSRQIVQHVTSMGGETKDYILLPPGSTLSSGS